MAAPVVIHSPADARQAGIGLVPIDRKQQGLVLTQNVRQNLTLVQLAGGLTPGLLPATGGAPTCADLDRSPGHPRGRRHGDRDPFHERRQSAKSGAGPLAGSQRQGPADERADLGRRCGRSLRYLRPAGGAGPSRGLGILMVSSDMQEVLSVSHRIITMFQGRITGEFAVSEATQEKLLHAAAGGEAMSESTQAATIGPNRLQARLKSSALSEGAGLVVMYVIILVAMSFLSPYFLTGAQLLQSPAGTVPSWASSPCLRRCSWWAAALTCRWAPPSPWSA